MFVIEQAIHGYSAGHCLLAASADVPAALHPVMLELSDVLGQQLVGRECGYLSGYPHQDSKRFVLARTWADRESGRPGSVLTHSLVLDYSLLAALQDLSLLLPLLETPVHPRAVRELKPIEITRRELIARSPRATPPAGPLQNGSKLLGALYGSKSASYVELESQGPQADEMLAIAAWRQMWPSFRRNFAFFTQPDAGRLSVKAACLLQFSTRTPRSGNTFGEPHARDAESAWAIGYSALEKDLPRRGPTALRSFLARNVYDSQMPRQMVPVIAAFHELAVRKKLPLDQVLKLTGPELAGDAGLSRLKANILAYVAGPSVDLTAFQQAFELFGSNEADPISLRKGLPPLDAGGDRIGAILDNLDRSPTSIAATAARSVFSGLSVDVAARRTPVRVLDTALRIRPELLRSDAFWSRPDVGRRRALELAFDHGLPADAAIAHLEKIESVEELNWIADAWPDSISVLYRSALKHGGSAAIWAQLARCDDLVSMILTGALQPSVRFLDAVCAAALDKGRYLNVTPLTLEHLYSRAVTDSPTNPIAWAAHAMLVSAFGQEGAFALAARWFETAYQAGANYRLRSSWANLARNSLKDGWRYSEDELMVALLACAATVDKVEPLGLFLASASLKSSIAIARYLKRALGPDGLLRVYVQATSSAAGPAREMALRGIEEVQPSVRKPKRK